MTDFTFPGGNIGGTPVPTLSSVVLLNDGSGRTGNGTVSTILGLNQTRVVTAAGAVTAAATDVYILINKTTGAATTVNLPSSPYTGLRLVIKDAKGDAGSNNITITPAAGNIDGSTTKVLNTNYSFVTLIYNGSSWSIVG